MIRGKGKGKPFENAKLLLSTFSASSIANDFRLSSRERLVSLWFRQGPRVESSRVGVPGAVFWLAPRPRGRDGRGVVDPPPSPHPDLASCYSVAVLEWRDPPPSPHPDLASCYSVAVLEWRDPPPSTHPDLASCYGVAVLVWRDPPLSRDLAIFLY